MVLNQQRFTQYSTIVVVLVVVIIIMHLSHKSAINYMWKINNTEYIILVE